MPDRIENVLSAVPGVARAEVNLGRRKATIEGLAGALRCEGKHSPAPRALTILEGSGDVYRKTVESGGVMMQRRSGPC